MRLGVPIQQMTYLCLLANKTIIGLPVPSEELETLTPDRQLQLLTLFLLQEKEKNNIFPLA